jgi:hypothetical protein
MEGALARSRVARAGAAEAAGQGAVGTDVRSATARCLGAGLERSATARSIRAEFGGAFARASYRAVLAGNRGTSADATEGTLLAGNRGTDATASTVFAGDRGTAADATQSAVSSCHCGAAADATQSAVESGLARSDSGADAGRESASCLLSIRHAVRSAEARGASVPAALWTVGISGRAARSAAGTDRRAARVLAASFVANRGRGAGPGERRMAEEEQSAVDHRRSDRDRGDRRRDFLFREREGYAATRCADQRVAANCANRNSPKL